MALLFAQLATAHHSAVHLEHTTSVISYASEIEGDHSPDHQKLSQHVCPECLLSKSLNVPLTVSELSDEAYSSFEKLDIVIENERADLAFIQKYTYARGPPSFLI